MKTAKIKIDGMSCDHCVKTVHDALIAIDGVSSAKVDLKKNEAKVKFDPLLVKMDDLSKVIADADFTFVSSKLTMF